MVNQQTNAIIQQLKQKLNQSDLNSTPNTQQPNEIIVDDIIDENVCNSNNNKSDVIEKKNSIIYKSSKDEKPLEYIFFPQPDINVYELSKILSFLEMMISPDVYNALSDNLKKHFIKFNDQTQN